MKGTPYRDCVRVNQPPLEGHPEFSMHPPGVALLLAPILFPFRGTQLIEPLAICCSAIAMIIAMLMFRSLIRKYNSNSAFVDLVTVVTFLGTPAWHYGRTLFNEPYLLLFAIGSYSLALRGKYPILAGILIGLGMLMKPPFALLIIPLFSMYFVERQFTSAALLVLPAVASLTAFLWLDFIMFGSPWRLAQEWQQGSFLRGSGVDAVLLEITGYLIIAPAIIDRLCGVASLLSSLSARRDGADVGDQSLLRSFCLLWEAGPERAVMPHATWCQSCHCCLHPSHRCPTRNSGKCDTCDMGSLQFARYLLLSTASLQCPIGNTGIPTRFMLR